MAVSWIPGHFPLLDRYLNGTIQIVLLKIIFAIAVLRTGIWEEALNQGRAISAEMSSNNLSDRSLRYNTRKGQTIESIYVGKHPFP